MNAAVRDKASAAFGSQGESKPAEATPLENNHVLHMYCRFCGDVSVAQEDSNNSLLKMIVLFQKNINTEIAYKELFSESAFIDWERVPSLMNKREKGYGDSTTWVGLMKYITVDIPDMKALCKTHPLFLHYADCLHKAGVAVKPTEFISLYLLVNICRLDTLHVFEQYFSLTMNKDTRKEGMLFLSQLANMQFDRDVQTKALVALIKNHCSVKADQVNQELEIMQLKSRELHGLFKQKQMRAVIGRPKLRSKLKAMGTTTSMFQIDRMNNWSNVIRFPNVFSLTQKKRLYFVMSQVHMDPSHYVRTLLSDREISETVVKYPVKAPDVEVIFECITGCRITTEPFPQLHQFRAECFHSFAHEQKTKLRLNDILHLYISAYQAPSIWKAVWKLVFPVLSIQIIRDVESFVERVPFTHENVVSLMFGKTLEEVRPRKPTTTMSRPISPISHVELMSRPMSPTTTLDSRPLSPTTTEPNPVAIVIADTTGKTFQDELAAYENDLREQEDMLKTIAEFKMAMSLQGSGS